MALVEFKPLKRFANGRDEKGNLIVYDRFKKAKAEKKDVETWAKRGWVEYPIEKDK